MSRRRERLCRGRTNLPVCYICGWQLRVRLPEWALPTFCVSGALLRHGLKLARVRDAAERVARSYGLEMFDVQLRREPVGMVLRVVIDRPDPGKAVRARPEDDAVGIARAVSASART